MSQTRPSSPHVVPSLMDRVQIANDLYNKKLDALQSGMEALYNLVNAMPGPSIGEVEFHIEHSHGATKIEFEQLQLNAEGERVDEVWGTMDEEEAIALAQDAHMGI